MDRNNPFLYFHFKKYASLNRPFAFNEPTEIYRAQHHEEVIPRLQQVLTKVAEGYYAAGFISYEAAPAFQSNVQVHHHKLPLLWFGIFQNPIEWTHEEQRNRPFSLSGWKPQISFNEYAEQVHKIKRFIDHGETEQVNYTVRLLSEFTGDPFSYFKQLEQTQIANYHAYINIGPYKILSVSPELFFHLDKQTITTRPMKGTIHRGKTFAEDVLLADWLQTSDKNLHENRLITKLMIEELSTIADRKTIKVVDEFALEKYPTLYQMTSTITAKLSPQKNIIDILQALFPNGSITGNPKQRTMKIITELEATPREVFTGAIGYISPNQEAIFNVPIRTVIVDENKKSAQFGVGGAITKHSEATEEFQEILTKAKLLTNPRPTFKLLESFGLVDGEYLVFNNHITRLQQSANYFNYPIDLTKINGALKSIAEQYPKNKWKVRLLLDESGKYSITIEKIKQVPKQVTVALADKPIDKENIFLYHKTTYRKMYEQAINQNKQPDVFDWILWNENKEITEFTRGNIVVKMNGELYTPPIACGLLPGTFRKELLAKGIIHEKKISIDDLHQCEEIWFINSVREWILVKLIQ